MTFALFMQYALAYFVLACCFGFMYRLLPPWLFHTRGASELDKEFHDHANGNRVVAACLWPASFILGLVSGLALGFVAGVSASTQAAESVLKFVLKFLNKHIDKQ